MTDKNDSYETFTIVVTPEQADQLEYYLTDTGPTLGLVPVFWTAVPGVPADAARQMMTEAVTR